LAIAAALAGAAAMALSRRRRRAESAWVGRLLEARMRSGGSPRGFAATSLLLGIAVLGTTLALAQPRWGMSSQTVERRGLDIVFVVDSSLSMNAADVAPSRFWLAESLVRRLAQALPGHRVALVAGEGEGEVMAPLTIDAAVLDLVLDSLEPGSLAIAGTRLSKALDRALTLFPPGSETHRAIVLLSDGEDHGGELGRTVARLRDAGVVVAAIGIGTERGAPIPMPAQPGTYKLDRDGSTVISRLHPETLRELASGTGGIYVEARDANFDPSPVARRLSAIGGRKIEATAVRTLEERFQWALAPAAVALLAMLYFSPWRRPEVDA